MKKGCICPGTVYADPPRAFCRQGASGKAAAHVRMRLCLRVRCPAESLEASSLVSDALEGSAQGRHKKRHSVSFRVKRRERAGRLFDQVRRWKILYAGQELHIKGVSWRWFKIPPQRSLGEGRWGNASRKCGNSKKN